MQDELAENQVPSPGYSGTNGEIELETFEWDVYEYFGDIEYGADSYWDSNISHLKSMQPAKTGEKRKRGLEKAQPEKRRKGSGKQAQPDSSEMGENVIYKTFEQRMPPSPPRLERRLSFALLPDWRERFSNDNAAFEVKSMPADMQKAAQATDDDSPPSKSKSKRKSAVTQRKILPPEDELEDDEVWEDDEDEDDAESGMAIDLEAIKAVLKQKLGPAADGMDEAAFMGAIQKMLSGEGGAEDDLASMLIDKATEGGDAAAMDFLSQQGVSLDAGDDASSVATEEIPQSPAANQILQPSPTDSAIDDRSQSLGKAVEEAPTSSPKKSRKSKTAKRVTFDVPASSSSQLAVELQQNAEAHEADQEADAPKQLTSEDPLMSEPTITEMATRTRKAKGVNEAAVKLNGKDSGKATGQIVEAEPMQAKQTRKRKAEVEELEEAVKQPAKKQLTRANGPKLETAKRTRSAKAKAGK